MKEDDFYNDLGMHKEWTYDFKGNRQSYRWVSRYDTGCLLPMALLLLATLMVR
jgi:hypothetical protein